MNQNISCRVLCEKQFDAGDLKKLIKV